MSTVICGAADVIRRSQGGKQDRVGSSEGNGLKCFVPLSNSSEQGAKKFGIHVLNQMKEKKKNSTAWDSL